jgi:beta-phosphoglucomutase-like phosphatase (HAD superfamily)
VGDVRFLLWDFGDTLVDERFLWTCPTGVPAWSDCYRTLVGGDFGTRWNRGTADLDELATEMAARLGMSPKAVHAHVRRCSARIRFFEHAWTAARARERPQAIVTVNPDLFRDLIVSTYRLAEVFDTIVVSAEEGTDSKTALCDIAMTRLGCVDPAEALLLDNVEANVDAWRRHGGAAYRFAGDEDFASVFRTGGWNALATNSEHLTTRH